MSRIYSKEEMPRLVMAIGFGAQGQGIGSFPEKLTQVDFSASPFTHEEVVKAEKELNELTLQEWELFNSGDDIDLREIDKKCPIAVDIINRYYNYY